MSDTSGADRSDGNGLLFEWLEENWESFGVSKPPAIEPEEEPPVFVWYPMFMGYFAWPRWLHNLGRNGFDQ